MNNNKKLIIFVIAFLCFAIFLVSAYFGYGSLVAKYSEEKTIDEKSTVQKQDNIKKPGLKQNATKGSDKEKVLAKDFVVYDENKNPVKLSDYKGTPVVLNFWASWCPPCKAEMPYFNEIAKKYSKDKIAILMINLTDGEQETNSIAQQYIKDNNYEMKVLFDSKMDAANKYDISSIPRTIYIDKDGYIFQDNPAGAISKKELENQIKLLLNEK